MMSRVEADLGSVELASKDSGLRLRLSSRATFAASEEDDVDRVRTELTSPSPNVSSNPPLWTTWAPDFQLRLEFPASHVLDAESRAALIQTLAARLKNAELWQQLCLATTSIEHQESTKNAQLITIHLVPDNGSTHSATPRMHKLGVDVPHLDVHPPEGVRHVILQSVHLTFEFEQSRQRKRRKGALPEGLPTNVQAVGDSQMTPSAANPERGAFAYSRPDEDEPPAGFSAWNDWITYDDGELAEPMDDIMLLTPDYMENEAGGEFDYSSSAVAENDRLMHLIDAAIRVAMTESPRALGNGVAVTALQSFRQLSEVAPALWSPGFLSNVATRAVFLPTIRCALGMVCSRPDSRFNSSLDPYAAARRRYISPDKPSLLLWRMLAKGSQRPHMARRLKPLSDGKGNTGPDPDLGYELLDSSQDSWTDITYEAELIEDFELMEDREDEEDILDFYDLEDHDMAVWQGKTEGRLLEGESLWDYEECLLENDHTWDGEDYLVMMD